MVFSLFKKNPEKENGKFEKEAKYYLLLVQKFIETNIERKKKEIRQDDDSKTIDILIKGTIERMESSLKDVNEFKDKYLVLRERYKHQADIKMQIAKDWNGYWKSWHARIFGDHPDKTDEEHQKEIDIKMEEIQKRFDKLLIK